ncbi:STAS domain-containing protein [Streptomyces sp. M19]
MSAADAAPRIRAYRLRGYTVAEFHGEVDLLGLEVMGPRMDELTSAAGAALVVDLRPVTFFDCSGLSLLCRAHRRVAARLGRMRLVCDNDLALRTMRAGGLLAVFRPVPTLEEALTAEPLDRPDVGTDVGTDVGRGVGTDIGRDIGRDVGRDVGRDL